MDMKKKNRPNDVISIPHRSYVSLNGYTWSFRVETVLYMETFFFFLLFDRLCVK